MKITGRKSQPMGPMGPMNAPAEQETAQAAAFQGGEADSVSLASTTQIRMLAQAAAALPTMRMEKVVELRGQIDEGSYYVESEKLARKVVDDAIQDILANQAKEARG